MKTYFTFKNEIEGLKDVADTVKVVEDVAGSSVHMLREEVFNFRNYGGALEKVLIRLSLFYQKNDHPLLQKRNKGKKVLLILTGDKGLVGSLWHNVINGFLEKRSEYQEIIVVGEKGKRYLNEERVPISKIFNDFSNIPTEEEISQVTDYIFSEFNKGEILKVDVLYPHFVSLAEQQASLSPFLPFTFELKTGRQDPLDFPIFEPSTKKIFFDLLQKYIRVFLHEIVFETKLSELSARTVSMESAGEKTKNLIKKTNLSYLKERRRFVTQKQLESFTSHKATVQTI